MTVVVASPCRAKALSAALRLDINDVEMELLCFVQANAMCGGVFIIFSIEI
jgi:hypothetical protein